MIRWPLFILVCLLFNWNGYTQNTSIIQNEITLNEEDENLKISPRNQVKVNLATLLWKTGSINYERQLAKRWSIGVTANYRPKSSAPFKSNLQDVFGKTNETYLDNSFDINQLTYGNWSISPEVKVYLSKPGVFKGFYIAGFAKYENIDLEYDLPLTFDIQGHNIQSILPLTGNIKPWSGGIYFGYQWKLGKNWYLDWQIIGGNLGSGTLNVAAHQTLTEYEQQQIKAFAANLQDELSDLEYEVNNQGVRIWGNIPWTGLRTGVSIGFTF